MHACVCRGTCLRELEVLGSVSITRVCVRAWMDVGACIHAPPEISLASFDRGRHGERES